jgi:hypothetical protein
MAYITDPDGTGDFTLHSQKFDGDTASLGQQLQLLPKSTIDTLGATSGPGWIAYDTTNGTVVIIGPGGQTRSLLYTAVAGGKPPIAGPRNLTNVATIGTSAVNLQSYVLPASSLIASGDMVIVTGEFNRGAGLLGLNVVLSATFAGNALYSFSKLLSLSTAFSGEVIHTIVRTGTTTATVYSKLTSSIAGNDSGQVNLTGLNFAVNNTLQFIGQVGDGGTPMTQTLSWPVYQN